MTAEEKKAKNKAFYERCKQEGRCVNCGLPVEIGEIRCKSCKEKEHQAYLKRRNKRLTSGMCVKCGHNQALDGLTMCEACKRANLQYRKEQDQFCKDTGICIKCHKEKAEKGYLMCLQCRMDAREQNKQYKRPVESRKAEYEKSKQLRDDRKANGQCPLCGRQIHSYDNHIYCEYCRAKARKREKAKRERQGVISNDMRGNGIFCAVCRNPVDVSGEKMCDRCRENCLKNITKAWEHRSEENGFAWSIRLQWAQSAIKKQLYAERINK